MTDQTDSEDGQLDGILDGIAAPDPAAAARRAPYDALVADLRALAPPASGWRDRVAARIAAEQAMARRRRRALVGGGLAVFAAAVILVLVTRDRTPPRCGPTVAIATIAPDGAPRRGAAAVGDTLRLVAERNAPGGQQVELRVYRGGRLVLRCPGPTGCTVGRQLEAQVRLDEPGLYRVVRLTARGAIPPPETGPNASLDLDLLTLREAGVAIELQPSFEVTP